MDNTYKTMTLERRIKELTAERDELLELRDELLELIQRWSSHRSEWDQELASDTRKIFKHKGGE